MNWIHWLTFWLYLNGGCYIQFSQDWKQYLFILSTKAAPIFFRKFSEILVQMSHLILNVITHLWIYGPIGNFHIKFPLLKYEYPCLVYFLVSDWLVSLLTKCSDVINRLHTLVTVSALSEIRLPFIAGTNKHKLVPWDSQTFNWEGSQRE